MSVEVEFINADITVEFIDEVVTPELSGDQIAVEFLDTQPVVEFIGQDITVDTTTTVTEVTVENPVVTVEMPQVIINQSGGGGGGGGEVYDDTNPIYPGLGVTTFQGAVESLTVGAASTSFIYNSSGGAGGTRYNDWAALMAAINLSQYGGPRNIVFEQDETIPPGTYDLTDVTLLGNGISYGQSITDTIYVTLQTGVTITSDVLSIGNALNLESTSVDPIINVTTPRSLIIIVRDSASISTTTAPFIYVDPVVAPNQFAGSLILNNSSVAFGAIAAQSDPGRPLGGYELISDDSGQFWVFTVQPTATRWSDDLIRCSVGAAASTILYWYIADGSGLSPGGFINGQTNANMSPGYTLIYNYLQSANQLLFSAQTSAGLWVGGDPTLTVDAIDRLAVAVSGLIGGPVPNIP